jgi:hypothetical protein
VVECVGTADGEQAEPPREKADSTGSHLGLAPSLATAWRALGLRKVEG